MALTLEADFLRFVLLDCVNRLETVIEAKPYQPAEALTAGELESWRELDRAGFVHFFTGRGWRLTDKGRAEYERLLLARPAAFHNPPPPPAPAIEPEFLAKAEAAGYEAGSKGPTLENCHFTYFKSRACSAAWSRGYDRAKAEKPETRRPPAINLKSHASRTGIKKGRFIREGSE